MATKRPAVEAGGAPPSKKPSLALSPLDIGPAAGEEDLDLKVLQIQNSKLSERLRERNRCQEQLRQQVEKLEQRHEDELRLQVILKQHFLRLRECLLVAMVPLGREECVMSEEEVNRVKEIDGLDKVMQSLYQCLEKLCRVRYKTEDMPISGEETSDGQVGSIQSDTGVVGSIQSGTSEVGSIQNEVASHSLSVLDKIVKHQKEVETRQLQDNLAVMETKMEELEEEIANLRFSLEQSQTRGDRLEVRLESALVAVRTGPVFQAQSSDEGAQSFEEGGQEGGNGASIESAPEGTASLDEKSNPDETESAQEELTEAKELCKSRLEEIEKLSSQLAEARKEMDSLHLDQQRLPDSLIKESSTYKSLQAQFSIAALEGSQLRTCLDEAKALLVSARQQHFSQLEEIRGEEVKYQMEVREEMAGLEGALAALKRDYELLRIEFERMVASNEQAGPIAKELRVTVESLQKTISQHKSEVSRYKARAHKAEQQVIKLQEEKGKESIEKGSLSVPKDVISDVEVTGKGDEQSELEKAKAQLKSLQAELDGYKQACSPEEKEKAETVVADKKARNQVEELKRRFEDYRRDYEKRKEHIREEAARKTKALTEDNRHLQKDLSAKKHEAQALVAEMECTAQAFEEMQEQNIRLLQQLKEKDDANFKLMSERIKSNSLHKLLLEEKELMQNQLNTIVTERQRYAELISQLEERERTTEATLQSVDKELVLQQQASESHRKKAQESVQGMTEMQLQVEEHQRQIESVQQILANKTDECQKESQLYQRSLEEVGTLKRKLDKYKTREWMTAGDEVLLEEIKVYKAKLNCPCCSARKKDTVLTKCFHVFCSECIKNRYDSRLRKCPKCGAAFGANDFHKIYLS